MRLCSKTLVAIYIDINQMTPNFFNKKIWRPQGESNPCYRRERAVS
jgi:hypothetical protein